MKKTFAFMLAMLTLFTASCGNKGNSASTDKTNSTNGTQTDVSGTSGYIGEEKAKEIALSKAGLSASDVIFERVELDRDDGVVCYEIEFRNGRTEFDAEIKADDGKILSWEADLDD